LAKRFLHLEPAITGGPRRFAGAVDIGISPALTERMTTMQQLNEESKKKEQIVRKLHALKELGNAYGNRPLPIGQIDGRTLTGNLLHVIARNYQEGDAYYESLLDKLGTEIRTAGGIKGMLAASRTEEQGRILRQFGTTLSNIFGNIFHTGGLVPGKGNVPAMLEGGEYVLNKKLTQALAKGGLVQYMQTGDVVPTTTGGGGGVFELNISNDLKAAIESFRTASDNFTAPADRLAESMGGLSNVADKLTSSIDTLNGAGEMINEASVMFAATMNTFSNAVAEIPSEIKIAGVDAMEQAINMFVGGINIFNTNMNTHITGLNEAVQSFGGYINEFADIMSQEIRISVTHNPIEVNINGEITTDADENTLGDLIRRVVAPEIEKVKKQIREGVFT
jgi:hypothetical protein